MSSLRRRKAAATKKGAAGKNALLLKAELEERVANATGAAVMCLYLGRQGRREGELMPSPPSPSCFAMFAPVRYRPFKKNFYKCVTRLTSHRVRVHNHFIIIIYHAVNYFATL